MHPADIKISQYKMSVSELYKKMKLGEIDLDISQKWNPQNQSMSIESILLGLTMTPIYVDASNPKLWIVLDGQKRLLSIKRFLNNELLLKKLEFFEIYEGEKFHNLPLSIQNKFKETNFTIHAISQDVPSDIRWSLMKRIVPDLKASLKIRKSLLSRKSIEYFTSLVSLVHQVAPEKNQGSFCEELALLFLHNYFLHTQSKEQHIEDSIIVFNKTQDKYRVVQALERGINRTQDIFGSTRAFQGKNGEFSKGLFKVLSIYFGIGLSSESYEELYNERHLFLERWSNNYPKIQKEIIKSTRLSAKVLVKQFTLLNQIQRNDYQNILQEL